MKGRSRNSTSHLGGFSLGIVQFCYSFHRHSVLAAVPGVPVADARVQRIGKRDPSEASGV